MISLRHIEVFHAVYSNGSVSGAARSLNVSQPSVTKVLKHAEMLLGFPLFERAKGGLVPTEDAHTLFADVAEIQDRVYALRQASKNLRQGRTGTLRISALPSLSLNVLPATAARFLATHQGVGFDLQTVHHEDMVRKLYERETDVVIGYEVPPDAPVSHRWLGEAELVVLFRDEDMPDPPARIAFEELKGRPFISPIRSGPVGRLLLGELQRLDVHLDEVVSARTFYIASALVQAGVGMAIVDNFTAHAALGPGLSYRPLQPSLVFDVHAIHLQNRPPSGLATAFLKLMGDAIESL